MEQVCSVLGITSSEEIAKMAALLINNGGLTWWSLVAIELWAKLGINLGQTWFLHMASIFS